MTPHGDRGGLHGPRRSLRHPGHDYTTPGPYFVTICTRRRVRLFGHVVAGVMELSLAGFLVRDEWFRTGVVRPSVRLREDEFVVMPDHIHGIIWLDDQIGAPALLGNVIGQFKSNATKRTNDALQSPGQQRWQRGYYEHVIRSVRDLIRIREYIRDNPRRWVPGHRRLDLDVSPGRRR